MNPAWTGRLKIPIRQVAKTTDDFEARRFAEDLYYRLEEKARRSEPINSATFRRVFLPSGQGARRRASGSDGEIRERGNVRRVEIWALSTLPTPRWTG